MGDKAMTNIKIPERISLANLPTRIQKLDRLSKEMNGINLYVKRDDETGSEMSGNKVRKLEFAVKEALDMGCDTLITCGGIQSNHARATAAAAARIGMNSCLVLRSDEKPEVDGNYFLDKVIGADVRIISSEDYSTRRMEIMESIKNEYDLKGYKAYIIPEGASNGIGNFGYFKCMEEITVQETEIGIKFDTILVAVGSGGTYSGLFLYNKVFNEGKNIIGVNVCDDADYFKNRIYNILQESLDYLHTSSEISRDEINIIDGYVGIGYAKSRKEEIDFIYNLAKLEGIILDPVYTGKALYGFVSEAKKGNLKGMKNVLFIHTGGLFGLFPKKNMFDY
jgi:D-cysteine desulfhydrase